ncbi:MAG: response regulator [Kiritimatiellae bacterium]|nr:response regulator [Kiritimatiellia bacterium]
MQECFASHLYSIVAAISLAVHLIVNWKQLFVWCDPGSRPGAFEIRHFLVCLTVFFATDVLWGVFEEMKWRTWLYADTLLFFLAMALSVFAWTHFIAAYLEMKGPPRAHLLWTGRGLLAFFTAALVVNFFTGGFFAIDRNCVYAAGPVRQVALLTLVGINAYGSLATLYRSVNARGSLRRRHTMVFAIGTVQTAAILFQLGDPFLPLYGLGCLFGVCLLHVFVVEDEHDEMHRKEMLAHDVAAQLEAEREANRAKSLFFSTVSHDIRTPLNAIVGFSELLSQGVEDGAERARCLASIRSSAKVLARLVDDVLDLSKMESGKLEIIEEPTDVPALVREVVAACEVARARTSLVLRTDIGEMPWLEVDPQRIRQLLFNLLSNAYKYTAFGTISVRARWQDGTLELAVSDTGKGISEENIARILQPFVQLADRNHRDGTGLGLPICRKLANLMGGELSVESKIGVGSTFTIALRNVRTAEPPAGRTARAARQPGRVPSRVLVVDDSPVNRAVLKAMLAKCGVTAVAVAENGRKALSQLKADPHFDLVLTDLWMPEMDGCALVKAIRADARLAHLPVHLVTADIEARKQVGADGFTGLLLKPLTLGRLQALFE